MFGCDERDSLRLIIIVVEEQVPQSRIHERFERCLVSDLTTRGAL